MACVSNALIVGGGIAGLSSALALARIGVHCEVAEIASAPAAGSSIGISGRAAEALDDLGAYDECAAVSTRFDPSAGLLVQYDAAGDVIDPGPRLPPPWPGAKTGLGIYRPVLLAALASQAQAREVTIRPGVTVDAFGNGADRVCATFTDGTAGEYDLIIGCDGINSATRRALMPEISEPAYSGQVSIRWMAPGPDLPHPGWYHSALGRFGGYSVPHGGIYVPVVLDRPRRERWTDAEVYAALDDLLASFTAPRAVSLRERLKPDAELICRPFDWIFVQNRWYRGRVLLLGDAAHATTAHLGQGGGMALEDAVVLGQCVAASQDLNSALAEFTRRRYERCRVVVESSAQLSRLELDGADRSQNSALVGAAMRTLSQPY